MTFFEKIMEMAERNGIANVNQLSNVSGIPYNALRQCKEKNKPLSENHKRMLAKALKCDRGIINGMMSEALAEELAEQSPEKVKCSPSKPEAELASEPEPIPVPEPEPVPEAEPLTEDQILDEKIEEIKAKADVLLTYHDRVKGTAEAELAAEYAAMLRNRMLAVAISDLAELCGQFTQAPDPNKAAAFVDVASEILKLKEGE